MKAARNSAIGCACLLAVIEGVGIGVQRLMAENTRLDVSSSLLRVLIIPVSSARFFFRLICYSQFYPCDPLNIRRRSNIKVLATTTATTGSLEYRKFTVSNVSLSLHKIDVLFPGNSLSTSVSHRRPPSHSLSISIPKFTPTTPNQI